MSTLAGNEIASYADGTGAMAFFNRPMGIAIDSKGMLYVSDANSHVIRKISPSSESLSIIKYTCILQITKICFQLIYCNSCVCLCMCMCVRFV